MEKSILKTVIITGANSGLGFETAKKIAADTNFRLILACRNPEKAENAADQADAAPYGGEEHDIYHQQ